MQELTFRPLRRIQKTSKIVVASYAGWNRIRTANYAPFRLRIDREYAGLPADEFVYDHAGNNLFWPGLLPAEIPVFHADVLRVLDIPLSHLFEDFAGHALDWGQGSLGYCAHGLDCQGTPTFSHLTADHLATYSQPLDDYSPLTVGMVVKWFGWFVYQLENVTLL